MDFSFEAIYEYFAKPLDGVQIDATPFGPGLIRVLVRNNEVTGYSASEPGLVLPFLVVQGGKERLKDLIDTILKADSVMAAKKGADCCVILIHEAQMKEVPDDFADVEAQKNKGLIHDPLAKNVIAIQMHHASGVRMGFLDIDKQRKVSYSPLRPAAAILVHINVGAEQGGKDAEGA